MLSRVSLVVLLGLAAIAAAGHSSEEYGGENYHFIVRFPFSIILAEKFLMKRTTEMRCKNAG